MKIYKNEKIEVDGNVVFFDGKLSDGTLRVYAYHGDINLRDEAFQNFAIDNKITTVIY